MQENKVKQPKIITFNNEKGGVGKTTTACCLAYNLSTGGLSDYPDKRKILLIDLDSQNQDRYFFQDLRNKKLDYSDFEKGELVINKGSIVDLITVGYSLQNSNLNVEFIKAIRNALKKMDYDYILIDTHPSFREALIGLQLADSVQVVSETSQPSFDQIEKIIETVNDINKNGNFQPEIGGVIVAMKDRSNSDKRVLKLIEDTYPTIMYHTVIKRLSKIRDFFDQGISQRYARERDAMSEFRALSDEFKRRNEE